MNREELVQLRYLLEKWQKKQTEATISEIWSNQIIEEIEAEIKIMEGGI